MNGILNLKCCYLIQRYQFMFVYSYPIYFRFFDQLQSIELSNSSIFHLIERNN